MHPPTHQPVAGAEPHHPHAAEEFEREPGAAAPSGAPTYNCATSAPGTLPRLVTVKDTFTLSPSGVTRNPPKAGKQEES